MSDRGSFPAVSLVLMIACILGGNVALAESEGVTFAYQHIGPAPSFRPTITNVQIVDLDQDDLRRVVDAQPGDFDGDVASFAVAPPPFVPNFDVRTSKFGDWTGEIAGAIG